MDQQSKRYEFLLIMFSIVVIMLSVFGVLLYFSRAESYFPIIIFYLNLFSIVWALLAFSFFINVVYKDRQIKKIKKAYLEGHTKKHLQMAPGRDMAAWWKRNPHEVWEIAKWFIMVVIILGISTGALDRLPGEVERHLFIFGAVFFLVLSVFFYFILTRQGARTRPAIIFKNAEYKTITSAIIASGLGIFAVLTNYYNLTILIKLLIWSSLIWAAAALFFFYSAINSVHFISKQYYNIYMKAFHRELEDLSLSELLRLLIRRREEYRKGSLWLVVMSLFLSTWGFIMEYAIDNLIDDQISILGHLLLIVAMVWLIGAFLILFYLIKNIRYSKKERSDKGIVNEGKIDYIDSLGIKKESTLYGKRLNISGKPDLIIEKDGYYIPMEVKTGKVPEGPYYSHVLQLATYLKLVEDNYGVRPPYGYIQYGEKKENRYKINYDAKLEVMLERKVDEILRHLAGEQVHRNHYRLGKCLNCSRRAACPEALEEGTERGLDSDDVKEGKELEITVVGVGKKNDGVARIGDFVIFVPDLGMGDVAKVRVEEIKDNLVFTKVLEVIEIHSKKMEGKRKIISDPKTDDEIIISIISMGKMGDGIAKEGGYVIFVPGAEKGDKVRARVTEVKKNLIFTELKEVIELGS